MECIISSNARFNRSLFLLLLLPLSVLYLCSTPETQSCGAGEGAYGRVLKCRNRLFNRNDNQSHEFVAVKEMKTCPDDDDAEQVDDNLESNVYMLIWLSLSSRWRMSRPVLPPCRIAPNEQTITNVDKDVRFSMLADLAHRTERS